MREVTIGNETVPIAATPMTLYIYSREFGPKADLIGDLMSFAALQEGRLQDVRFIVLAQMLWAMAKTAKLGREFPSFEDWMAKIDLDFSDSKLWEAVLEEAAQGLFRSTTTRAATTTRASGGRGRPAAVHPGDS